jgi:hypothetical protein
MLAEDPGRTQPQLGIPNAAAQTRIVSKARIRLNSRKSVRSFTGIICDDISEFESSHPSHAVGLSQVRSPAIVRGSLLHAFLEASGIRIDVEDGGPIEHHEFAVLRPARLRVPRRRGAACKDDECRTAGPLIVILILSNLPSEMSHQGGLGPLVANFLQHAELSVSVSLHSRRNLTPVPSCLTFAAERFPTWSPRRNYRPRSAPPRLVSTYKRPPQLAASPLGMAHSRPPIDGSPLAGS